MPDPVVVFAAVILLVPMGYFLLAAPAFLLVKLDIPAVTLLLRGMEKLTSASAANPIILVSGYLVVPANRALRSYS